jgi:subtilase family serine protease
VDLPVPLLSIAGLNDYERPLPGSGTGSGTNGSFMGKDFRAAYVPGATALTGAGQTIAIVSFESDYHTNDITAYETAAGLPNVLLHKVQLSGYDGSTQYDNLEISLDIEMAMSMAPGVNSLIVYEGTLDKPEDMFNRIATDNSARQVTSSWFSYGNALLDPIFQQFAAQGQTFFVTIQVRIHPFAPA